MTTPLAGAPLADTPPEALPPWPDAIETQRQLRIRIHTPLGVTAPATVYLTGDVTHAAAVVHDHADFTDLELGWHEVHLEAPGFLQSHPFSIQIREGQSHFVAVALDPEPTTPVKFRVRDVATGQPIPQALVVVLLGTRTLEQTTDASGHCEVLVPGPIRGYRVVAAGYLTLRRFRVSDPHTTDIAVDLASEGALVQLQLYEPSNSQGLTTVSAYCRDGESWHFSHSATADSAGVATLPALHPGDYQFRFTRDGVPIPESTLDLSVQLGEQRTLHHTLGPTSD